MLHILKCLMISDGTTPLELKQLSTVSGTWIRSGKKEDHQNCITMYITNFCVVLTADTKVIYISCEVILTFMCVYLSFNYDCKNVRPVTTKQLHCTNHLQHQFYNNYLYIIQQFTWAFIYDVTSSLTDVFCIYVTIIPTLLPS